MSFSDTSLLKEKLALFEANQAFAWINQSIEGTLEVESSSGTFPLLEEGKTYILKELIHPRDYERVHIYFAAATSKVSNIQFRIKLKGTTSIEIVCTSIVTADGIHSLWLPSQAGQAMSVIQTASHDIRSPINAILGLTNLAHDMIKEGEMNEDQLDKMLTMIKNSCYDATDLTTDILELARMESDQYKIRTSAVGMKNFITQYVNTHRLLTLKKKIKVETLLNADVQIKLNRSMATRALDNLVTNAVKFSQVGSTILVSLDETENHAVVKVEDRGVGMSGRMIEQLFVKFGTSQRRGLEGEASHGLGMSIVKQIMEVHQGEVQVESQEGTGTIVSLLFNK